MSNIVIILILVYIALCVPLILRLIATHKSISVFILRLKIYIKSSKKCRLPTILLICITKLKMFQLEKDHIKFKYNNNGTHYDIKLYYDLECSKFTTINYCVFDIAYDNFDKMKTFFINSDSNSEVSLVSHLQTYILKYLADILNKHNFNIKSITEGFDTDDFKIVKHDLAFFDIEDKNMVYQPMKSITKHLMIEGNIDNDIFEVINNRMLVDLPKCLLHINRNPNNTELFIYKEIN